jgi:hypothetical protein
MTDRELLEMAAKAAGHPIRSDAWACSMGGGQPKLYMGNGGPVWNPLTDDGDALRLAVRLGLLCTPEFHHFLAVERFAGQDKDDCHAHRRAIVRAAAEIGRQQ